MSTAYFQLEPNSTCSGNAAVPGDKSISHRAVMLASLARGMSKVAGFLPSTDCEATLNAFQDMGVKIERDNQTNVRIHGVGVNGLSSSNKPLDMGNSGTAMRLMSGILSGQKFNSTLVGDASLSSRPMQRIATPLIQMGASFATKNGGTPPLVISSASELTGIHYALPVSSAQVKSCVLLAGIYAKGKTCVEEKTPTRDHTERMLQTLSYPIEINNRSVCLEGGGQLLASDIEIPGDISSAAFLMVGALISNNATLIIRNVGVNPTRDGVVQILQLMGADIQVTNQRNMGMEPVADLVIKSSDLHGIEIPHSLIANSIDEFPIIFIAAACANGTTTLTGAEELRVKESDRIAEMVAGLKILDVDVDEKPDGLIINGGKMSGGEINSGGDHRIAMSFAIASIRANQTITVRDTDNVMTSFPNFVEVLSGLGLKISQH